jgi:NADPH:quinone reductase-like Zn-dependent oxidoreductase
MQFLRPTFSQLLIVLVAAFPLVAVAQPATMKAIVLHKSGGPDPGELEKHGIRGVGLGAHPDAKVLEELAKLIDAGKITPIVSAVMPLVDVAKAQEQIASRHTRGKIVLKIAETPK